MIGITKDDIIVISNVMGIHPQDVINAIECAISPLVDAQQAMEDLGILEERGHNDTN